MTEAQRQLVGCKKLASTDVANTVRAAVKNAVGFGLDSDRLVVEQAFVGKGKYLKKIRPWHGKGRYGIEEKKYAHLTVIVKELSDEEWERRVLPQYVHMRYRSEKEAERRCKEFNLEGWTTQSQLDLSFKMTREKVQGLAAALKS